MGHAKAALGNHNLWLPEANPDNGARAIRLDKRTQSLEPQSRGSFVERTLGDEDDDHQKPHVFLCFLAAGSEVSRIFFHRKEKMWKGSVYFYLPLRVEALRIGMGQLINPLVTLVVVSLQVE